MRYCKNCDQHVEPEGRINWLIALCLLVFTAGTLFIPYLVYCLVLKDKSCPQCEAANWGDSDHDHSGDEDEE